MFIRETYKRTILSKRTKGADQVPNPSGHETSVGTTHVAQTSVLFAVARPLHMLFAEPTVTVFGVYIAYSFATVYAFFAAVPWIYARVYDFDITSQGLVFISLAIGYSLAVLTIILADLARKRRQIRKKFSDDASGHPMAPEEHLYLAMLGSVAFPISLFWFGWTLRSSVHWIVPTTAIALYAWGSLLIYVSSPYISSSNVQQQFANQN